MTARGLRDFAGYIFDLDGTVYLGDALLPGAGAALASLRTAGKRLAYVSNKAIGAASDFAAKLNRLGVPAAVEEVINSAVALRLFLSAERPGARVFVIGEEPVRAELRAGGFVLTDEPAEAEVVAVSWDRQVDYARLNLALDALRRGAFFVATNPDVTCPMPGGCEWLDAGSFVALLEAASGRAVEAVAGKPSPLMLEVILRQWNLTAPECLFVGDRLDTDMELGRRAGVPTALVLTGVTTRAMLRDCPQSPDFILESIAELG